MKEKRCRGCHTLKPEVDFSRKTSSPDGRQSQCRACRKAYATRNRKVLAEKAKIYYARPEVKERYRSWQMQREYGISSEERDNLAKSQDWKCAICKWPEGDGRLHVDHDHFTGKVRGLLCGKCNRGIGMFSDNPLILAEAISYLTGETCATLPL